LNGRTPLSEKGSRIYVAGGDTFIGGALMRRLADRGVGGLIREREPDLTDRASVEQFFLRTRPDLVFVAAGRTAGIAGNQASPADLMVDNLLVGTHVISSAWNAGTTKLLYLASSCIYPKAAPPPFGVSSLWTGPVEPTSGAYAVAKLAGVRLCDAFRIQHGSRFFAAVAADVYGPGDDFSTDRSHVVAALLRRMHEAKQLSAPSVEIWGSGAPRREFIYVDDLADACIFAMHQYDGNEPLNLGTGVTTSIREVAETIREVVGYEGDLRFDSSKPDGMPFKGLDSTPLRSLGWEPAYSLRSGLLKTSEWFATAML
jgi:GDP-L-fucose synthase